jgi:hypothetical protein
VKSIAKAIVFRWLGLDRAGNGNGSAIPGRTRAQDTAKPVLAEGVFVE